MKLKIAGQIIALFVVPVVLLATGVVPLQYRFWILGLLTAFVIGEMVIKRWPFKTIGLRTDNLKQGIIPYIAFTLAGTIAIVLMAKLLGKQPVTEWWGYSHFLFWFAPISFVQELAFRSYLMPKLEHVVEKTWVVIGINGLLFALMHVIYPDPLLLFPLGLAAGVGFAAMYRAYPNLWLISLSHMVLNFVTTLHCFFSFANSGC